MPGKTLRILCFGDSLTQGFYDYCSELEMTPYSKQLSRRLREALPETELVMVTCGVPGDIAAHRSFRERFSREITQMPFDWVITLGGTNDIGSAVRVDDTFKSLQKIWGFALTRRCSVLALTVPETAVDIGRITSKRNDLNEQILDHEAEDYHAFDLHAHIPYQSLDQSQRDLYWADNVHLSRDGYRWMGDHIADALIPLIIANTARLEEEEEIADKAKLEEEEEEYVVLGKDDLD